MWKLPNALPEDGFRLVRGRHSSEREYVLKNHKNLTLESPYQTSQQVQSRITFSRCQLQYSSLAQFVLLPAPVQRTKQVSRNRAVLWETKNPNSVLAKVISKRICQHTKKQQKINQQNSTNMSSLAPHPCIANCDMY